MQEQEQPTCDIFYKTYPGDEEWLNYSIRSVNQYAEGFRQIIIVSNRGHEYSPPPGRIPVKYIEVDVPPDDEAYSHGVDYWWQMGIKMSWNQFSDADEVLLADSDYFFYRPFSPATWKLEGKVTWCRSPWEQVGEGTVWKPGVDYFLGKDVAWSHMVRSGFYMTRSSLRAYVDYMLERFGQAPLEFFIDLNHPKTSEYETFGAYMDECRHHDYLMLQPDQLHLKNWPIRQYWSWGGITDEIRLEIEQYL